MDDALPVANYLSTYATTDVKYYYIIVCVRKASRDKFEMTVLSVYVYPTQVCGWYFFLLFLSTESNQPTELALYRIEIIINCRTTTIMCARHIIGVSLHRYYIKRFHCRVRCKTTSCYIIQYRRFSRFVLFGFLCLNARVLFFRLHECRNVIIL